MGIINRIWPRESGPSEVDLSLAKRLEQLCEGQESGTREADQGASAQVKPSVPREASQAAAPVAEAKPDSGAAAASPEAPSPVEPKNSEPEEAPAADAKAAADPEPSSTGRDPEMPATEKPVAAAPEQQPAGEAAPEAQSAAEQDTLASARQLLADLQAAKEGFEAELRQRLDGAMAEFESRVSSHSAVEDAVGQIEQKSKLATGKVLRDVQEQTLVMFEAVVGEARTFRDQFNQVIQERTGTLERTTRQALELQGRMEKSLPQAEKVLQSLSATGQDASARLQAASAAFSDQLRNSSQALSGEIQAEKDALNVLARERKQEETILRDEIEKFRRETAAAYDIFGGMADKSLERLNAGVDEASARARGKLEDLVAQIEHRILSGGIIEKVTGQVEKAAESIVDRALERITNAGAQVESNSASLARASQQVVDRFGTARQEIESRLDGLMVEQRDSLQATMAGFQRKAAGDLGQAVEQVVSQSTRQLDERLRVLCNDLLVSTGKQIDGAARTALDTVHSGFKEALQPEPAEAQLVQLAESASPEA